MDGLNIWDGGVDTRGDRVQAFPSKRRTGAPSVVNFILSVFVLCILPWGSFHPFEEEFNCGIMNVATTKS